MAQLQGLLVAWADVISFFFLYFFGGRRRGVVFVGGKGK